MGDVNWHSPLHIFIDNCYFILDETIRFGKSAIITFLIDGRETS